MKQKIQLRIAEPCHENWNNMTPTAQGRFCMNCQKQVLDLTLMTDKEILEHISASSSGICGRAGNDQLNRVLHAPAEPHKIWWRYGMGVAASFLMLASRTNAQEKVDSAPVVCVPPGKKKNTPVGIRMGTVASVEKSQKVKMEIRGKVVDRKGVPVPYASVRLNDGIAGVAADSAGDFILRAEAVIVGSCLSVSSVGYEPVFFEIADSANIKSITVREGAVQMDIAAVILNEQVMGNVLVTAFSASRLSRMAGGLSVISKISKYEKIKASFKDAVGTNEIKIYPNPISANSSYTIYLRMKETGWCTLQFTDVSGKIIESRQINITAKSQPEVFSGNMFTAKGYYFVSAVNRESRRLYTAKLLVQ